jgi:serine/threonine protein kinase
MTARGDNWQVDENDLIGSGGFGKVFGARGPSGEAVAAKYVPKAKSASRDLLALNLPKSPYVVPLLGVTETEDHWVLLMPRASQSLRDRMNDGPDISRYEALAILTDISRGLAAIDGELVHRDLKPENVLLLDGKWAICDFGISRYAEATTADDTRKRSLTPPYAAPEQWRTERATNATDVYAFGIIAFELLAGDRPFPGPTDEDFRNQHLHSAPPSPSTTRRLDSLLIECLDKAPAARPRPQNITVRLARAEQESKLPGAANLAGANQAVVEARSAQSREAEMERSERERRNDLYASAVGSYSRIFDGLIEIIEEEAPAAVIEQSVIGTEIRLGAGALFISMPEPNNVTHASLDVIAYGSISIRQYEPVNKSRSHSLYFCDFDERGSYAWFELAFIPNGGGVQVESAPYSLDPAEGLSAFDRQYGGVQLGMPVNRLTLGDVDDELDRWGNYLGLAAQGKFPTPNRLPEGNPSALRRP